MQLHSVTERRSECERGSRVESSGALASNIPPPPTPRPHPHFLPSLSGLGALVCSVRYEIRNSSMGSLVNDDGGYCISEPLYLHWSELKGMITALK